MKAPRIEDVLQRHAAELLSLPGVVGVAQGICDDKPCIRVFFAGRPAAGRVDIPTHLDGFRVKIEISGQFQATTDDV